MLRKFLALALVVLFLSGPTLAEPHGDADANNPSQPETLNSQPDSKIPRKTNSQPEDGGEHKKERCDYNGPNWFARFYCFFAKHDKFWVSFGTLILAAFTTILGFATIFLTRATNRLVEDSADKGERQLRAYISFEGFEPTVGAPNGIINEIAYSPVFKNTGQTPARSCNIWARVIFVGPNDGVPFFKEGEKRAEGSSGGFGANQMRRGSVVIISWDQMQSIHQKRCRAFLWTRIEYTDVFNRDYLTECCCELEAAYLRLDRDTGGRERGSDPFRQRYVGPQNRET